jgi:hypothetical protein
MANLCATVPAPPALSGRAKVVVILGIPAGLFFLTLQREWEIQRQNQLRQLSVALIDFCDDHGGEIPPAAVYDRNGKPLSSWRVLILPYLGEEDLYRSFHLDEAWDSSHNILLLPRIPKVYQTPGFTPLPSGLTDYQVFTGPGTPFPTRESGLQPYILPRGTNLWAPPRLRYPGHFPGGTSNTFAVVVAAEPVPWTRPDDLVCDPRKPFPRLAVANGSFHVSFFDSSVRRLPQSTDLQTLHNHVNPDGPLGIDIDW